MADTATPKIGAQVPYQVGETETYSKNILGPVAFTLCNLRVAGSAIEPTWPKEVAPAQSPFIVASDEEFAVSVDIDFNNSPLTKLLLCLGTKITVCFSFEGIGAKAVELDLEDMIVTEKDKFNYTLKWNGTPSKAGLTSGFYAIAAVATVGPVEHKCAPQCAYGFGYVAKVLMQVYEAFNETH
ncbi:MAG TPA: hypothetical protein ACFE0H_00585 [Elainellaceae cyanobacterium]